MWAPFPATLTPPGSLLKLKMTGFHPRPIESELWGRVYHSGLTSMPGDSDVPHSLRTIATDRFIGCACVSAELLQLCLTLWDHMLCSPSGSSVMEFFRWEHWSGLPCPPSEDVPHPGIEPASLVPPVLACGFFTTSITWEALIYRMSCDVKWKSLSCVQLFVVPWTKQSTKFFRWEYWSG